MSEEISPRVSIVITTRNRADELRRALESCANLGNVEFEILVYDDASDDRTSEMVRSEFPRVHLHRSETRVGLIVLRNRGFRDARGEYVVSIDDDAACTDPRMLERIVELFELYPRASAIALPFVEPNRPGPAGKMKPVPPGTPLRGYTGCAHALRRSVALDCEGYPELLVHQGEERDLCLRMIDRGHDIIYADTSPIIHYVSDRRSQSRMNYYGYRNTILFSWMRLPFPYWIARIGFDSVQLLRHKFRWRSLPTSLFALLSGYAACLLFFSERAPVRWATYQRYLRLPAHGPLVSSELPAAASPEAVHCL